MWTCIERSKIQVTLSDVFVTQKMVGANWAGINTI